MRTEGGESPLNKIGRGNNDGECHDHDDGDEECDDDDDEYGNECEHDGDEDEMKSNVSALETSLRSGRKKGRGTKM